MIVPWVGAEVARDARKLAVGDRGSLRSPSNDDQSLDCVSWFGWGGKTRLVGNHVDGTNITKARFVKGEDIVDDSRHDGG